MMRKTSPARTWLLGVLLLVIGCAERARDPGADVDRDDDSDLRADANLRGDADLRPGDPPEDASAREPGSSSAPGSGDEPREGAESAPDLERCLDAWLSSQGLDPFGNPEGTMYTGGTPLFDERTGERRSRVEYVFERHPEAKRSCPGSR